MGRGMKAGKKHREHLGKSGITWDVIHEAQRRIDAQYDTLRLDASVDATKTVQAMALYALYRMGNGIEEISIFLNEFTKVGEEINSGALNFDELYDVLNEIGVEVAI